MNYLTEDYMKYISGRDKWTI